MYDEPSWRDIKVTNGGPTFTWGANNADYTVASWIYIIATQGGWVAPFHKSDASGYDCCATTGQRAPAQFFFPGTTNLACVMATAARQMVVDRRRRPAAPQPKPSLATSPQQPKTGASAKPVAGKAASPKLALPRLPVPKSAVPKPSLAAREAETTVK